MKSAVAGNFLVLNKQEFVLSVQEAKLVQAAEPKTELKLIP